SKRDWSSDVCSSDLTNAAIGPSPATDTAVFTFLTVKAFGGEVYAFQPQGSISASVGTLAGPAGTTFVGLPGQASGQGEKDFYLRSEERRVGKEWRPG